MYKQLNILSVSDVHLGHTNCPTEHIIDRLDKMITAEQLVTIDLLLIAGDFFDSLLQLSDHEVGKIINYIGRLLVLVEKTDTALRVLKGTPSHDWDQSELFVTINNLMTSPADVKYVDKLDIVYEERFGVNCLYVPDEWRNECSTTLAEVKQMMVDKGLKKVHYAFMHGMMDYQVPEHFNIDCHDSEEYLKLVSNEIFIGHYHDPSKHDRIHVQGSTDILEFSDEHTDKGFWIVQSDLTDPSKSKSTFIINSDPWTFLRLDERIVDVRKEVQKVVYQLRNGSNIQLRVKRNSPLVAFFRECQIKYPMFRWVLDLIVEEGNNKSREYRGKISLFQPRKMTNKTIPNLVAESMGVAGHDIDFIKKCKTRIRDIIED